MRAGSLAACLGDLGFGDSWEIFWRKTFIGRLFGHVLRHALSRVSGHVHGRVGTYVCRHLWCDIRLASGRGRGHGHIGHNYIGHDYIGHIYIGSGHNYVGHNCTDIRFGFRPWTSTLRAWQHNSRRSTAYMCLDVCLDMCLDMCINLCLGTWLDPEHIFKPML